MFAFSPAAVFAAGALDLPAAPGEFWLAPNVGRDARVATPPQSETLLFSSLAALTEHALRTRPESRAAWLSAQAESARLEAASAANWPTLAGQFNFTQSRALSSTGASVPTLHRYGPSFSLAYVLVDFGARASGIEAQRYQLVVSLLNHNRALQDTVVAVETAYFAVRAAQARVAAQTAQAAALRASLEAVEVRLRGGLAARADQLRARAALAEASLAQHAAARDADKAMAGLRQAAGVSQTQTLALDWADTPPSSPEAMTLLADLLAEAQLRRPDLRALQAAAARARAEAERARAARWPSLTLAANTGRTFFLEDERTPSSTYSLGVNLAIPLFDGGKLKAEARAAQREAERLGAETEGRQNDIALAVAQAYYDARHAQQQRDGVTLQFDSADESARAAQARYTAGVGSLLELLTAQADLARAREAVATSASDWFAAFSRLNHALGRLPALVPGTQP